MTEPMANDPQTPLVEPPASRDKITSAGMTPEQLAEANHYGQSQSSCSRIDRCIGLAFLLIALAAAWPLDSELQSWRCLAESRSLRLGALFLIITATRLVLSFPFSFYSGYILEHRFGFSTLSPVRWFWRYLLANVLAVTLGLLLVVALYLTIWTVGAWWWLPAAGVFFVVSVAIGQLTPVLILPLFYKIESLDTPDLAARIHSLVEGTGLSIDGVYRIALSDETVKVNAMLAGLGRTRRVLLGDTLLGCFTPDEVAVILAHEVGHHVFRHIPKNLLLGLLYSAASFWFADYLLADCMGQIEYDVLPVATLPLLLLARRIMDSLLRPLDNAIRRHQERQCDLYALERTRRPDAFISAFSKLAQRNKTTPRLARLNVIFSHGHPPIGERLAMAQQWQIASCDDRRPQTLDETGDG
jgi:STE24 endopeptidase